jgi:hypothetical protein
MRQVLFVSLAEHFPKLHPDIPTVIIDENAFALRVSPAVMTVRYDPSADIVFSTEHGSPTGYFRIVQEAGAAKFRLENQSKTMFIDEAAQHLVTLLTDYAPKLQYALDNPR